MELVFRSAAPSLSNRGRSTWAMSPFYSCCHQVAGALTFLFFVSRFRPGKAHPSTQTRTGSDVDSGFTANQTFTLHQDMPTEEGQKVRAPGFTSCVKPMAATMLLSGCLHGVPETAVEPSTTLLATVLCGHSLKSEEKPTLEGFLSLSIFLSLSPSLSCIVGEDEKKRRGNTLDNALPPCDTGDMPRHHMGVMNTMKGT